MWLFLLESNKYWQIITTNKAQKVSEEVNTMKLLTTIKDFIPETETDKKLIEIFGKRRRGRVSQDDERALEEILLDKNATKWNCTCNVSNEKDHHCDYIGVFGTIYNEGNCTYTGQIGNHFSAIATRCGYDLDNRPIIGVKVIGPDINRFLGIALPPSEILMDTLTKEGKRRYMFPTAESVYKEVLLRTYQARLERIEDNRRSK